jgi:peptidoglycan/xylan/chitin deacetylase (PgdA/CDA1 family)
LLRRSPLVLCYHAVSDSWNHRLSVPPKMFARQLAQLMRLYRPAAAEQVVFEGVPGLHVTFDDAFRSVVNAVPTLRDFGVPATVFVCSGYGREGRSLQVSELTDELRAYPDELATMTWEELRELANDGIEIGSHTVSHPHLSRLDDAELRRELVESRERVEDEIGRPCRFLAYPFGEEDDRVRAATRHAGYLAAFALRTNHVPVDPFSFPRLGIWREDRLLRTAAKIALRRDHRRRSSTAARVHPTHTAS